MKTKKGLFPEPKKVMSMGGTPHRKEITIREADGGFIVSSTGADYGTKEKVYRSVSALKKCVEEKFGGGGEEAYKE